MKESIIRITLALSMLFLLNYSSAVFSAGTHELDKQAVLEKIRQTASKAENFMSINNKLWALGTTIDEREKLLAELEQATKEFSIDSKLEPQRRLEKVAKKKLAEAKLLIKILKLSRKEQAEQLAKLSQTEIGKKIAVLI